MDCDRIRDLLSDYLEEGLADGDRAIVAAHVDRCPDCAAEAAGLAETLALLSALPRESAPPELLDRVTKGIEREAAGARGWKRVLTPARVKIPLEAAAAVFLVILVYGIQKGMPPGSGTPEGGAGILPAASVPAPDPAPPPPDASPPARGAGKAPSGAAKGGNAGRPVPERASPRAPTAESEDAVQPAGNARVESRDSGPSPASVGSESHGAAAPIGREREAAGLTAVPAFLVAPAARVSSAEETIEPRVFAAPPSRMLKPVPFGREVTLEVASGERPGIEQKIVEAAERLGGGVYPGAVSRAEGAQPLLAGAVRVHLPAASAGAFLDALKGFGTIPPEGMPAAVDLPAGPSPGVVAYTVRIRVR